MRRIIETLPPLAEFAIVVLGAFGYFIVVSLLAAFWPGAPTAHISNDRLLVLIDYELILLLVLLGFLRLRGWTIARLGIEAGVGETLVGFGLAGVGYVAYVVAYLAIAAAWPQAALAMKSSNVTSPGISVVIVIAVSLVNPVFEEVFVCGYVVTVLRKASDPWAGVHLSVAIRLLYHLYQGAVAAIGVVPFGLIMALWYARTGRLWPVIIAHAVTDFAALLHYVR